MHSSGERVDGGRANAFSFVRAPPSPLQTPANSPSPSFASYGHCAHLSWQHTCAVIAAVKDDAGTRASWVRTHTHQNMKHTIACAFKFLTTTQLLSPCASLPRTILSLFRTQATSQDLAELQAEPHRARIMHGFKQTKRRLRLSHQRLRHC